MNRVEKQAKIDYWRATIIILEAAIAYAKRYAEHTLVRLWLVPPMANFNDRRANDRRERCLQSAV